MNLPTKWNPLKTTRRRPFKALAPTASSLRQHVRDDLPHAGTPSSGVVLAVRLLLALAVLCMSGCRKLPNFFQPQHAQQVTAPVVEEARVTAAEPVAIDHHAQAIMLGYHRFVEKVRRPDTEITPADFEAQMNTLKDKGIAVISLADFAAWRRGEKSIPPASALISIDDGYKQAYDVAWPVLKRLGYPFALFIYTDYVKGGPKSGGGSITWDQLAELRDAGVEIGSHTVSHPDLRAKGNKASAANYEAWLWNELNGSKALIEQKLGIKVTALALPYGRSNEQVRELAAKAGYEMIFTVNGEKIGCDTPLDALGRYMIDSSKPKIFASAVTFDRASQAEGAAAFALQLFDSEPADGATISDPKPMIRANLSALGSIENGSVTLRISGIGAVAAAFDPKTNTVSYQVAENLRPSNYTAIVSAKAEGRKGEARWSFTVQGEDNSGSAAPAENSP